MLSLQHLTAYGHQGIQPCLPPTLFPPTPHHMPCPLPPVCCPHTTALA